LAKFEKTDLEGSMSSKPTWKPDNEALKALIRKTIDAAGPIAPDALPSKIKERLKGQATGDLDVDAYIKEVMAETRKG